MGGLMAHSLSTWSVGYAWVLEKPSIGSVSFVAISGEPPIFAGTRAPVQTLINYLEAGESIDNFLDGFPTVKRKQVIALLDEIKKLPSEKPLNMPGESL